MNNNHQEITLVKSKFTKAHWLESRTGKRLTPKFVLIDAEEADRFVKLNTSKGVIIYNKCCDKIIYHSEGKEGGEDLIKLTEKVYCLEFYNNEFGYCYQLYSPEGKLLSSSIITEVYYVGDGIIALQDTFGHWELVNESLRKIVPNTYEEVYRDKTEHIFAFTKACTDIITIDKAGKTHVATANGLFAKYMSPDVILVNSSNIRNKKYGLAKINGEEVCPIIYNYIKMVECNGSIYFIVEKEQKYGLLDSEGNVLCECIYYAIEFKDGKALGTMRKIVESTCEIALATKKQ